jgi:pyruvate kinase
VRHTKIIATIGPATSSEASIRELLVAGVDVFRLNFSHGNHETHAETLARVRAAADEHGRCVAVLQDLSGPKIRTGRLQGGQPIPLNNGDELRIAVGDFVGGSGRVSTSYADLPKAVRKGDPLLLDDGRIQLRVEDNDGTELRTTVIDGGMLGEHKGINAPGVPLAGSALTPKDRADLEYGVRLGVDFIAMSFVQRPQDVVDARSALEATGAATLPIIAKIERPSALECIDQIFDVCDGIMVARGDLGLEVPLERVPSIQKDLTRRARARGLPVIVATQVLESMRQEPRPTRAEVSDAANAVDQGVDAIMLAGETAVGQYPVRAVRTLDLIIREAETLPQVEPPPAEGGPGRSGYNIAICEAAITLAASSDADAIVAVTRGGKTARWLSMLRPASPIYGATDNEGVARRLALSWGVVPVVCAPGDVKVIQRELTAKGVLVSGAVVVFVSVSPDLSRSDANFLNLQKLA